MVGCARELHLMRCTKRWMWIGPQCTNSQPRERERESDKQKRIKKEAATVNNVTPFVIACWPQLEITSFTSFAFHERARTCVIFVLCVVLFLCLRINNSNWLSTHLYLTPLSSPRAMLAVSKLYVSWRRMSAAAAPFRSSSDGNFMKFRCIVTFSKNSVKINFLLLLLIKQTAR